MIQTGIVGSHTCFYSAKIYFVIPLFFNEPQGPEVEGLHGSRLMVGSVKPDGFVPEGERREEREISRIHVSKKKTILWWLRMCYLFLTLGTGCIFKSYTHPVTDKVGIPKQKTKYKRDTSNSDHEK